MVKTMNGSSVTAKIAGMESSAKMRSVVSTINRTSASGVKARRPSTVVRKRWPSRLAENGKNFRAARIDTGYLERLLAVGPAPVQETISDDIVALTAALFSVSARREMVPAGDVAAESRWAVAGRREGLRL